MKNTQPNIEQFISRGYALGASPDATLAYQNFCFCSKRPFLCVSKLKSHKLRVTVRLYCGTRLTELGQQLLSTTFERGSTKQRPPMVGIKRASANVVPERLDEVLAEVVKLLGDTRVITPAHGVLAMLAKQPGPDAGISQILSRSGLTQSSFRGRDADRQQATSSSLRRPALEGGSAITSL